MRAKLPVLLWAERGQRRGSPVHPVSANAPSVERGWCRCHGPEWGFPGTGCVCNLLKGFGGHLGSGLATPWGRALALAQGTGLAPWQQAGCAPTSGCWCGGTGWVTDPGRLVWVGSTGVVLGPLQSLSHTSSWVSGW